MSGAIVKRTGASLNRGGSQQVVGTPWRFIRAVEKRWGALSFDLAASADNAKAPRYFTRAQNALLQPWHELTGNLWLNPEYEQNDHFMAKCHEEFVRPHAWRRILVLVPAAIGTNWFSEHVLNYAAVIGINGRIQFEGHAQGYPKDLMLLSYGDFATLSVWRWNQRRLNVAKL